MYTSITNTFSMNSWLLSMEDDDKPMLALAKRLISNGRECLLVTNDNFRDHIHEGDITQEWFDQYVVSYMWLGGSNRLFLNLPHDVAANLPHLQDGGGLGRA